MRNNQLIIMALIVLLSACEKGELPVPPHESGNVLTNTVSVGPDYGNQVFFSLGQNEVISTNLKTDWDLAFENGDSAKHIRLNTSKGMAAAHYTGAFATVTDTIGAGWRWDWQSGNEDSTAIGDWLVNGGVYVIDRGYDAAGQHQGLCKLQVIAVSPSSYEIAFGDLSETAAQTFTVSKNLDFDYSYFSFSSGSQVTIAPEKTTWDILFTQYTHIFEGPVPYLVTGVLVNPYRTSVAVVDDRPFEEIVFEDIPSFAFSDHWNTIGYDWKYFNFDAGLYEVDASITYVVHTQSEYYYKLHFVDFYNESGVKGWPKFEFVRL